jgi:hypothetical protein
MKKRQPRPVCQHSDAPYNSELHEEYHVGGNAVVIANDNDQEQVDPKIIRRTREMRSVSFCCF